MVMGEEFTTKIFRHLDEQEIKTIGEYMAKVQQVEPRSAMAIMNEFSDNYQGGSGVGMSGKNFLERTVSKAFDTRKADGLLDDLFERRGSASFDNLGSLSPQVLANILISEHPQTIALILVNMKYQTAAEIIQELPEHVRSEVIVRIADLDEVPNEIVMEIQSVIEEQVSNISKDSNENLGGIQTAAEILNNLDQKTENAILENIEGEREELAEEIRQSMFVFEDLVQLDDRSIRAMLKEISNDELTLALKTASDELSDKIFSNVSQRAAQMMKVMVTRLIVLASADGPLRWRQRERSRRAPPD